MRDVELHHQTLAIFEIIPETGNVFFIEVYENGALIENVRIDQPELERIESLSTESVIDGFTVEETAEIVRQWGWYKDLRDA